MTSNKELIDKLKQIVADFEQSEIPEGWTRWEATEDSKWPGHPDDVVDVMLSCDHKQKGCRASMWRWSAPTSITAYKPTFIIAYKLVKKYEEPKAVNPWFYPKVGDKIAWLSVSGDDSVGYRFSEASKADCDSEPYLRLECAEAVVEAMNALIRWQAMGDALEDGKMQCFVDDMGDIELYECAQWKMCYGAVFNLPERLRDALKEFGGVEYLQKMRLQFVTGRKQDD